MNLFKQILVLLVLAVFICPRPSQAVNTDGGKLGLFILGLPGSNQFKDYFDKAPWRLRKALLANGYTREGLVKFSHHKPSKESAEDWGVSELAEKDPMLAYLDSLKSKTNPYEQVFVFIGGHANGRDDEAVLHLPGDDLMYRDLMEKLKAIPAKQMILVVAAPQGESWIEKMAAQNRVVIAGNGYRQYDFIPMQFLKVFPEMFEDASRPDDPNQTQWQVSLRDIFVGTQQKVRNWYRVNHLHNTELALIDADGDGKGESFFVENPGTEKKETSAENAVTSETVPPPAPEFATVTKEADDGAFEAMPYLKESDKRYPVNLELPDAKRAETIYFQIKRGEL